MQCRPSKTEANLRILKTLNQIEESSTFQLKELEGKQRRRGGIEINPKLDGRKGEEADSFFFFVFVFVLVLVTHISS